MKKPGWLDLLDVLAYVFFGLILIPLFRKLTETGQPCPDCARWRHRFRIVKGLAFMLVFLAVSVLMVRMIWRLF
jgi:hypothetical protein